MTDTDSAGPERFRLLATFLAGRPLGVTTAAAGESAYTDGRFVFISADRTAAEQRREVLLQSALLGAGSLDQNVVRALRGNSRLARRYLALEGRRVWSRLATASPLAASLGMPGEPTTSTADESLEMARGRGRIAEPPEWFGVIRPSRLLGAAAAVKATPPSAADRRFEFEPMESSKKQEAENGDDGRESKILKLFENPVFGSKILSSLLYKLFGTSDSVGDDTAGEEMRTRSFRQVNAVGPNARPLPLPIRFTDDGTPGAAVGLGGACYPEWDVHSNKYRPQWCRVVDFPMLDVPDVSAAGVQHDELLRRRLSRLGLGPKVCRRRPDGDDLDIDGLIELSIDLRSGYSPPEDIYLERRKLARNLGVLILLDASGSTSESDPDGLCVHEHQRRAAATLAVTLEELGDRVAVYACRSLGRAAVHLLAIKPFAQRFGAGGRARLNQLRPEGYTRLGAAIRHAGEIIKTEAGTPNRLLLVLSDGVPYDHGYEARYAEADVHRALEEVRADGIACLCLSIGASTPTDTLQRVFGSASRASAPTLAELSPRMDELFLSALKELAASNSRGHPRTRQGRFI